MVATRGRTFKRPWRGSCHSSKLKSSSAPIGRKDSWCFHGVGSSNAPLLGSTAAEGLQRIGRTSIATRWRFCGLPQSASCSENFVIPPDVFGQTLRVEATSIRPPEREDGTLVAWYRSLYAPRTGGAYDSHHRKAGIAGCTRRRGGRVAARSAGAGGESGQISMRVSQFLIRRSQIRILRLHER